MKGHVRWLLGGVGLAYAGMGALVHRNVRKPNTFSHQDAFEFDRDQGAYTDELVDQLPKEVVSIPSEMGYNLFAYWIPFEGSKRTVILVHGITSNIFGALKYYELYRNMGFNVLTYDHRNHGRSGGTETTLGFHEKKDLETCIQWVKDKVGQESLVGTHGESMGAGTVIQHAATYPTLNFVVADCPFADLTRELMEVSKREHPIPMWMALPVASLMSKLRGNGWYKEASPIRMIDRIEIPLMIIHGAEDTYITPDHAQDLYDAKTKGLKGLYFAQNADHAQSIIKDRDNYIAEVRGFLEEAGVVPTLSL